MTIDGSTMLAILQHGYGDPQQVLRPGRIQRPTAGPGEVLIQLRATSVNTPDWITVSGVPAILRLGSGLRRPKQPVRGTDVAGVVVAAGPGVTDLRPGDEVFGSLWNSSLNARAGSFAEYAAVPATQLTRKPAAVSFEEAAASVMSGLTALTAIRDVGQVREGTRVLINGASGGVGTLAVQLAASLGAEVTGVCGTHNVELVRSLGAKHVIDYTSQDFTRSTQRYDLILDNVLNRPPKTTARLLAPGGVFLPNSIGNTGGLLAGLPRIARAQLMGLGSVEVKSVRIAMNPQTLGALAGLLESGTLRVVIDRTYPLDQAGAAVSHMLGHHARGKVAITIP